MSYAFDPFAENALNAADTNQQVEQSSTGVKPLAWVVGGTSGIGLAVASQLAQRGFRVCVMARDVRRLQYPTTDRKNEENLTSPQADPDMRHDNKTMPPRSSGSVLGGDANGHIFLQTDVFDARAFQSHLEGLLDNFGCPEVVFHSAGMDCPGALEDISLEEWDLTMGTNVRSVYVLLHVVVPHMRRKRVGAIVVNASTKGLVAQATEPVYCASKAALIMLMRSVALSAAADGVRINAICPGPVETRLLHNVEDVVRMVPLGRVATPDEVRDLVLFLLSRSASYITGAAIPVDGGKSAGRV